MHISACLQSRIAAFKKYDWMEKGNLFIVTIIIIIAYPAIWYRLFLL